MQITVTARHCELNDLLQQRARDVLSRIAGTAPRPVDAAAIFDMDGPSCVVELKLHISHGEVFVAHGEGADHRTALDRAEERLRRQVESATGRTRRARHQAEAKAT